MADLGSLNQKYIKQSHLRIIPIWRDLLTTQDYLNIDVTDTIVIIVNVDSSPIFHAEVYLYYRKNGKLIERGRTNINGQVSLNGLDALDTGGYFAIAKHDSLNYLIYGHL